MNIKEHQGKMNRISLGITGKIKKFFLEIVLATLLK